MLEQIVKKNVPFAGIYNNNGFDYKGRIRIPKQLLETLVGRQQAKEKAEIELFYRLHTKEIPKYLELTDYLPEGKTNFTCYKHFKLDKQNRVLITPDDLAKIGIQKSNPVVLVGYGNKILVYRAEDYNKYQDRSY